jgi:hypothetical protein
MQDEKVLTVYFAQKMQNPYDRLSSRRFAAPRFSRPLDKRVLEDVSCRELNCNSLCNASLEAMASARNLLLTLSIRDGFNPPGRRSK